MTLPRWRRDRGASAVTAELAEQALRLTPPDALDDRRRRALAAARAHLAAGEWTRARTIATDLLAETEAGPLRAEALLLLAEFEHDDLAVPVLEEAAARGVVATRRFRPRIHIRLAWAERFRKGFPTAVEGTRTALELADRLDDDVLRFEALAQLHLLGGMVGDVETPAYAERAHDLATAAGDARLLREANVLVSGMLSDSGSLDARRAAARARVSRVAGTRRALLRGGALGALVGRALGRSLGGRGGVRCPRPRRQRSSTGSRGTRTTSRASWVAVHRGRLELAQARVGARALKLCEEQIGFHPPLLLAVPGLVALWSGDAVDGRRRPRRRPTGRRRHSGGVQPDARPWTPDYAEALLELGRVDEAVRVIDLWEADARRLGRERVLAHVTRCRGLVAAAQRSCRRGSLASGAGGHAAR